MPNSSNFVVPVHERQLLLDDHGIAKLENLNRTMHQPVKKGAVIRPDPRLHVHAVQVRGAPIWDPEAKSFKVWLHDQPDDLDEKGISVAGYYESLDGLHWCKPSLRQVKHHGSIENNYALDASCVFLRDPIDPDPAGRYKGFGHSFDKVFPLASDGVTWRKLDVDPIPCWDEYMLNFDPLEKCFLGVLKDSGHAATYKGPKKKDATANVKNTSGAGRYGRSVWLTKSMDFRKWTPPELIFETDDLDQELARENIKERLSNPMLQQPLYNEPAYYNADVYTMAGPFRYEGLYVALPAIYHSTGLSRLYAPNTEGFHLVQLACSRDLRKWRRLGNRRPFIGPSPLGAGAYDLIQLLSSPPVVREDELWFYYTGIKYRETPEDADPDRGAICLAVLRRDGFFSLDAGDEPGVLLTQPFVLAGESLVVNVDAGRDGSLRVEVLADGDRPQAVSEPVTGNQLRGRVQWREGNLAAFNGRHVQLRFILQKANLYSYWLEEDR